MNFDKDKYFNLINTKRKYNSDEYYTTYENVENIFTSHIPSTKLKDKIIYCPCDSPESNFVIYLNQHKDDLQYKELIYTWDDYNTHIDLFEYCDVIITNPPFSKLTKEFIPILSKVNKEFFIFGSAVSLCTYYNNFYKYGISNVKFLIPDKRYDFIIPDYKETSNSIACVYITNIECCYKRSKIARKNIISDIYGIDTTGNKYKVYDRMDHIPMNEYDEILVPNSVLLENYGYLFDIINGNINIKQYTDKLTRYIRCLVKRKINK